MRALSSLAVAGAILLAALHGAGAGNPVYTICPEEPAIGSVGHKPVPAECRPVVIEDSQV